MDSRLREVLLGTVTYFRILSQSLIGGCPYLSVPIYPIYRLVCYDYVGNSHLILQPLSIVLVTIGLIYTLKDKKRE